MATPGYGNAINVTRTVAAFERIGVAAIQLEDQVMPKRCGHLADKSVVSIGEMVGKVRAAVEARDQMLVIARTDARASEGLDAAIERGPRLRRGGRRRVVRRGAPVDVKRSREVGSDRVRGTARLQLGRGWSFTGIDGDGGRPAGLPSPAPADLAPAVGDRGDAAHIGGDPLDRYRRSMARSVTTLSRASTKLIGLTERPRRGSEVSRRVTVRSGCSCASSAAP